MSVAEVTLEYHAKELALLKPIIDVAKDTPMSILNTICEQTFESNKPKMARLFATKN